VVQEEGARFAVRLDEKDALGTGIFVDQREGRRWVRAHSRGKRVLNLFSHAGAFGVAAHQGHAHQIDQVDGARKCARWAALNLALNGADPRSHRFMVEDAFKILDRMGKGRATYDVVVCDPPTTAISPGGKRFVAKNELADMAECIGRGLSPGGRLVLSTNDRSLATSQLIALAQQGLRAAGRQVRSREALPLPADIPLPADDERLRPARGVLAEVD
jgi:23S rRNA G2069 N7-methylase RlmK/C1962 C5-methylase RlmI